MAAGKKGVISIWPRLSEGTNVIFETKERLAPGQYMDLYTLVFNYCTSPHEADSSGGNADFIGAELYRYFVEYMQKLNIGLHQTFKDMTGEELLKKYTTIWADYQFSATVVNGIFQYLNRHWVKREIDGGRRDVYDIYTLCVVSWKQILFEGLHSNLTSAILNLIRKSREGEKINTSLISGVISSYIELGITESGGVLQQNHAVSKLAVFREYFEKAFIADTKNFYTKESSEFIQQNSIMAYLKKAESRIDEEQSFCDLNISQSTQEPLGVALNETLISQHLELFQAEFQKMLINYQDEDLGRMYALCQRVTDGLESFKGMLEGHIFRDGKESIEKIAAVASANPKVYTTTILEVHERFDKLVSKAFKKDPGFVQAMDKAFTSFINSNEVTNIFKTSSKSPELLSRYADQLLRKSAKNPEEGEMENLLQGVMVVFKYLDDKDVFQKFYSKMLAKRLVGELSASDEAESIMIANLKNMCGFEYTSKLQRMFTDASLSKELSGVYKHHLQNQNADTIDFSIMVLASGVWPYNPTPSYEIPSVLSHSIELFAPFYQEKHNGRKLNWLLHMGRGEITSHGFSRKYSFITSTSQMSILMLFNDVTESTLENISNRLKMPLEQVIPNLQTILKLELMKATPGGYELEQTAAGSTILELNNGFSSKKLKVDLSKMVLRGEVKKENDEVQKAVEDDRRLVIQAAIVRVMKMRKTLKHTQLMTEVIEQLSSRFQPKIPMIKKCIDILIDKEYLKRTQDDRDSYEYLA